MLLRVCPGVQQPCLPPQEQGEEALRLLHCVSQGQRNCSSLKGQPVTSVQQRLGGGGRNCCHFFPGLLPKHQGNHAQGRPHLKPAGNTGGLCRVILNKSLEHFSFPLQIIESEPWKKAPTPGRNLHSSGLSLPGTLLAQPLTALPESPFM